MSMKGSTPRLAPPILTQEDVYIALEHNLPPSATTFLAFYSTVLGGITNDPAAFVVPLDDHMVHRGHAVFDTCNVRNGKAYGLDFHLDRFLKSAKLAKIATPLHKDQLRQVILATIASTHQRDDIFVRFWLSAGRGDFWVSPAHTTGANFYCVVHGMKEKGDLKVKGVHEHVVGVPLKPPLLATIKSNNYLLNALTAMESEHKGGYLGIQVDSENRVAEGSIGNVAILDSEGVLRSPPFHKILMGTTVKRLWELSLPLIGKGVIKGVEYSEVTLGEIEGAREAYSLGGGHIVPIVSINNRPIGDGRVGPVFWELDRLLTQDMENSNNLDDIPYHLYKAGARPNSMLSRVKRVVRRCCRDRDLMGMGLIVFLLGYYMAKSRGPRLEATTIYM